MNDRDRPKEEVLAELFELRQAVQTLDRAEEERNQAERKLRNMNDLLRGILESSSSISIVFTDRKGIIRYWNKGAENIFGYTAKEIIGKPVEVLYTEDTKAIMASVRDTLFHEKRINVFGRQLDLKIDLPERRRDGSEVWMSMTLTVRYDKEGKVIGITGIGEDVTEVREATSRLEETTQRLRTTVEGVVAAMASTVEMRDPYTAGHQRRVAQIALAIATKMEIPKNSSDALYLAATIHDLGKISVPAEILSSPGKLSDTHFEIIKTHVDTGYEILKNIDFPWPIAEIVRQHHEKLDGSGYPLGIGGEEIMPESRILIVSDVLEAMASHRPYRASLGVDKALATIKQGRTTKFDADVVDACVELVKEHGGELNFSPDGGALL